jgi:hypothetical protein
MFEVDTKKLVQRFLCLTLLIFGLFLFSREATRDILVSAQSRQRQAPPPTVSIATQDNAPIRIVSTSVVSAEPSNFRLQVMIQNQSLKGIRAYTIVSETASDKKQGGNTDFLNLRTNIWQPTAIKATEVSDTQNDPIVRVNLTVDFVEFTDGTTWGPDTQHSSDILLGQREGARVERRRLRQLLRSKGPKAVIDDFQVADFSKAEALVGREHSAYWFDGFHSGVSSIQRRLKQASLSTNAEQIENELSKPFDTSEENQR